MWRQAAATSGGTSPGRWTARVGESFPREEWELSALSVPFVAVAEGEAFVGSKHCVGGAKSLTLARLWQSGKL